MTWRPFVMLPATSSTPTCAGPSWTVPFHALCIHFEFQVSRCLYTSLWLWTDHITGNRQNISGRKCIHVHPVHAAPDMYAYATFFILWGAYWASSSYQKVSCITRHCTLDPVISVVVVVLVLAVLAAREPARNAKMRRRLLDGVLEKNWIPKESQDWQTLKPLASPAIISYFVHMAIKGRSTWITLHIYSPAIVSRWYSV